MQEVVKGKKTPGAWIACNFHQVEIDAAGTIDDVVAHASRLGFDSTSRLIRDWTAKGLLDHPSRQPRGRGKGSRPALYSPQQRKLFLTLLHHRAAGQSIPGLARIPVSIWLYYPGTGVTGDQAKRALRTWLADPRSSQSDARRHALDTTAQLAAPQAIRSAKRHLTNVLAEIAYRGVLEDEEALRRAIRDVFEPGFEHIARSVGHPSAPLSTEAIVDIIRANLEGARLVIGDFIRLGDFESAGRIQRRTMRDYIAEQPQMAVGEWGQTANFYEAPTLARLVETSCSDVLTILGLRSLRSASSP